MFIETPLGLIFACHYASMMRIRDVYFTKFKKRQHYYYTAAATTPPPLTNGCAVVVVVVVVVVPYDS